MTQLTRRFDEALLYARHVHGGQVRKGSNIPYFAHLLGAAVIAIEFGANEDQAIAALLHDAVEDQGGQPRLDDIRLRFGEDVARMVDACTDTDVQPKPAWRPRKEAYLNHLETAPVDALLVSLSDKIHNAEAILSDLRAIGDEVWTRFTGEKEGTLWYYRSLDSIFARRIPGPAAVRLKFAVAELARTAGKAD